MKITHAILATTTAVFLTSCAATRTLSDVGLGAGGAVVASQFSHSPAAIAGGAAGGILLSEGLNYAAKSQAAKAYVSGYDQGRSDAVKQQYWLYVDMQKQNSRPGHVRLYPVQIPEQRIDGVLFQPTTKYLRIEE